MSSRSRDRDYGFARIEHPCSLRRNRKSEITWLDINRKARQRVKDASEWFSNLRVTSNRPHVALVVLPDRRIRTKAKNIDNRGRCLGM